jgi:hypothetical protein
MATQGDLAILIVESGKELRHQVLATLGVEFGKKVMQRGLAILAVGSGKVFHSVQVTAIARAW